MTVVKSDGIREEYFHTKVIGTIANALSATGQADIAVAEELAEAVTFFVHNTNEHRDVSSSEIFSIIEAALAGTGYEHEAIALSEHHFQRKLKRSRLEVITGMAKSDVTERPDMQLAIRSRWDKSRIVEDLVSTRGLGRQMARTIASMVEEKVFNLGLTAVPSGLVEQLVINDTIAVIHAQQHLQTV